MQYTTVEELLMDDGFLAWYHLSDDTQIVVWDAWIAASEDNRQLAREAVRTLQAIHFQQPSPNSKQTSDAIWQRIERTIQSTRKQPKVRLASPSLMLSSYIKVAVRNLRRGKMHSLINISGLSVGMAVAVLIGLWIWSEVSYDTYHQNYDRTAMVLMKYHNKSGDNGTGWSVPIPLAAALRDNYPGMFSSIAMTSHTGGSHTLASSDNKFTEPGAFMEPKAIDILALKMLKGTRAGLSDPHSIMLSASTAAKLFGDGDPMGKFVKMDNNTGMVLKVTGVYEDLPENDSYNDLHFVAPWELYVTAFDWIKPFIGSWGATMINVLVQVPPGTDMDSVSAKIGSLVTRLGQQQDKHYDMEPFLHPMRRWHLYSQFTNGVNTGGLITFVWLFGTIGVFVLLLACINFMNLSTARSEKRAREVGIRKVMGSVRGQLIQQFLSESILIALFSFVMALALAQLTLPWFNGVAGKHLSMPWDKGVFWILGMAFTLLTGVIAGSYPALFLSSFQPVKVLKGTFRLGRFAAAPRKILVVVQFTISVLLINGTIIVFREINYAKDRPVGYDRAGLVSIQETTPEVYINYNIIRNELLRSGAVLNMAESQCPITDIWAGDNRFEWTGKRPDQSNGFATVPVRHEFGRTIGWQVKQGRDFSKDFATDSMGLILNESAVKYMGLTHPIGQVIHHLTDIYTIIGVVKDMIQTSPYQSVPPTLFMILHEGGNFINIRLNPSMSAEASMKRVEAIFTRYNPGAPFNYTFADQDYAKKFGDEERFGNLALIFALLAIFISALGLFGLASFVAEQRTKEIGIRKVLGASLLSLWRLLSKEFALLIVISLIIASPLARYFMAKWLEHYTYRTGIPWWIFAGAGAGAMVLTLTTVSFQSIKTALLSPVKSLRSE